MVTIQCHPDTPLFQLAGMARGLGCQLVYRDYTVLMRRIEPAETVAEDEIERELTARSAPDRRHG